MKKTTRLLAAVPAAAGLLTGIVIAVLPHSHGHNGGGEPAATMPVVNPTSPTVDLTQFRWESFRGYRLPTSAQDGPRDTSGGLAAGYTDTPSGALLAIINIGARTAWQFGPAVFQPTIQGQVTGPYQADMLTADQDAYASGASQIPGIQVYAVIPAYRWVGYTPSDATVDLVASASGDDGTTVYVATQIEAQWQHGDWRVVAPPGGDWGSASVQVPSLTGYLTFPGQLGAMPCHARLSTRCA